MNQIQILLDIDEVYFDQSGSYQLTFQHQYCTEVISELKTAPKFEKNHFEIVTCTEGPEAFFLHVLVEDHQNGKAQIKAKTALQISPSSNFQQKEIVFTDSLTGFILIKYKTVNATSGRIIRSLHEKDYVLNVTVGFLNSLLENPFKLRATVLSQSLYHLSSLQLSNTHFHSVTKISRRFGQEGLVVRIQQLEVEQSFVFVTNVTSSAPSIVYITLASGDVLTVTLKFCDIDHNHLVGMVHSSVMREGTISTVPNENKPRLTLSPRRKSTITTPRSSMRNSKIPGTMKQILYLEDENLSEHTSFDEITSRLGAKLSVGHLNLTSAAHPSPGPPSLQNIDQADGTFMFSTSRSDVLEEETGHKAKHMKRRDLQNIVLGLVKMKRSYLTNPLRLRATLSDVIFIEQTDEVTGKLSQKPVAEVRFCGHLEETSREIFNESGLVTCALEGRLHIKDSKLDDNTIQDHIYDNITEKIMVFKLILSIVNYDAEETDLADTTSSPTREESPRDLASSSIDSILAKAVSEHQEKVQKLQEQQEEKYNVINEENKQPDELVGESEMNIPMIKQKLTPIPSAPPSKTASKESLQMNKSESKHSVTSNPNELKEGSNQNSKLNLRLENLLPNEDSTELYHQDPEDSVEEMQNILQQQSRINSKANSKQPSQQASNKSSHQTLPPHPEEEMNNSARDPTREPSQNPTNDPSREPSKSPTRNPTREPSKNPTRESTRQPTANNSYENLPSIPISQKQSQEDLYSLQRNQTGELEGFSQAFGENITVEDIIKRRFSNKELLKGPESLFPRNVEPNQKNVTLFAQIIKEELMEKQKLVEGLLQENKDKYKAIQVVGQDIKLLREENNQLKRKAGELENIIARQDEDKKTAETVMEEYLQTDKSLDSLSSTSLTHALSKLYQEHKHLQHQHEQLQQSLRDEQGKLATLSKEKDELDQQHQRLQTSQRQLQADFTSKKNEFEKLSYYQLTIQTQEKIINKLQHLLESKMKNKFTFLKDAPTGSSTANEHHHNNHHSINSKEYQELQQLRAMMAQQREKSEEAVNMIGNERGDDQETRKNSHAESIANNNEYEKLVQEVYDKSTQLQSSHQEIVHLNNKVETLEAQIEELKRSLSEAEQAKIRPSSSASLEDYNELDIKDLLEKNQFGQRPSSVNNLKKANLTIDKLTADNISKGFKIEALEKQLETSSRESAREIARLRTKLFELEIGIAMSSAGMDDTDEADQGFIASANTSSKTNKSIAPPTTTKPSSAASTSGQRYPITAGRSRNTILQDLEEQLTGRSQDDRQQQQQKIHEHPSYQSKIDIQKPENYTIPSQVPHPEILRNESMIDIDKFPSPKPSLKPDVLNESTPNTTGNERDLLNDIMNDIQGGPRRMSNVGTLEGGGGDSKKLLSEIMNDIGK